MNDEIVRLLKEKQISPEYSIPLTTQMRILREYYEKQTIKEIDDKEIGKILETLKTDRYPEDVRILKKDTLILCIPLTNEELAKKTYYERCRESEKFYKQIRANLE